MSERAPSLAPQPQALAALVERIAHRGRVVRTRGLPGGLGCRMDVLDIERRDGSRWKVSLRRRPKRSSASSRSSAPVERARIPAPRPILLDAEGDCFGVPSIVMSYLPGRPLFPTTNIGRWTDGLARVLLTVHAVTPDRFDLSGLGVCLSDGMRERIDGWQDEGQADPLATEIYSVLEAELERIDFSTPTLVHGDYWSGNTVAYRGRIIGIIDWSGAEVGDRRTDVSECRIDMVLSHGPEVAGGFRDGYERLSRGQLADLWYFDLCRGFNALLEYEHWLEGYHDMGLRHLKSEDVGARLRAFLHRALQRGR